MSSHIIVSDLSTHVRQIIISRIATKNALTGEMYVALTDALNSAQNSSHVRAVIIAGSDTLFCAGNDLNDFLEHPPTGHSAPPFLFLTALNNFNKPLIAATAGPAVGIGTTMLLHCDHIISANNTVFKMPFVSLGLTPEGGSSLLLPYLIGQRRACELLILGKSFDADYALELGLVNQVCQPNELLEQAFAIASTYAKQPPEAVQQAKKLLKAPFQADIARAIRTEGDVFTQRLRSAECKEAISAFFDKRAPQFE